MYTRPGKGGGGGGGGGSGVSYIVDRYLLPHSVLSGGSSPQQASKRVFNQRKLICFAGINNYPSLAFQLSYPDPLDSLLYPLLIFYPFIFFFVFHKHAADTCCMYLVN